MKVAERPFELSFKRREDIPPLAWCLEATLSTRVATVSHGVRVETSANAFVDGAWDGAYTRMAMDQGVCMGSGGRIRDNELVLIAPSHTLEALYTARVDDRLVVSNSLPFVLVRANLNLDPHYRRYLIDMRSIVRGLREYASVVPTQQHVPVERHYYCNFAVNRDLQLRRETKPESPHFATFEEYRNYIKGRLERIALNANDSARSFLYPLTATVSRGYDSPACAVLAKDCGCKQAFTISKSSWGNSIDSGREIGKLLSYDVIEREGQDYHAATGTPEAEFVALGDAGDVPFSSFEDVLPGRTLVTGFHGDKIWNPHKRHVSPDVRRSDASGSSIAEFRLRTGFIHVPVPFIGCRNHSDICAIGQSTELDPWRMGGSYDRPIPRRIAEEGGIPRQMFGRRKVAVAVWWTKKAPKAESKASYETFRSAHRNAVDKAVHLIHAPLHWLALRWSFLGDLAARVLRRLGIYVRVPQIVPLRFIEPPGEAQLVQWGMSIVRQRYEFKTDEQLQSSVESRGMEPVTEQVTGP